ncbi:MAG: hypothetical protein IPI66_13120 [Chitinophagaceae bacterium]|nr:hypothetical protein [Chitinophagaceae bacterium]MBL0056879.1 hypothetical protein [Chitinophagaceae bacterium]
MKAATLKDIQAELENRSSEELVSLISRLARFKKDNKELLTYLLFEAFDEEAFIRNVNSEVSEQFASINTSHLYFVKKSLRKILRGISKNARYAGTPAAELSMLLHFCRLIRDSGINLEANPVIFNLYHNQLKKMEKLMSGLHEDLQYDFRKELDQLG